MFSNIKIGVRLLLLVAWLIATLVLSSFIALRGLSFATETTQQFNQQISNQARLQAVSEIVQAGILGTITALDRSAITWEQARADLALARSDFEASWSAYTTGLSEVDRAFIDEVQGADLDVLLQGLNTVEQLVKSESKAALTVFTLNDLDRVVSPFLNGLSATTFQSQLEAEAALKIVYVSQNQYFMATLGIGLLGAVLSLIFGLLIYRSISQPVTTIANTVSAVAAGDFAARTELTSRDELGQLGQIFDRMLQERVSTLAAIESENEALNHSVINLLQAVSELSFNKDLTIKVPVSEDVIGPVADSLNLLTQETSSVLRGVVVISDTVSNTSQQIKQQSDTVLAVANAEQQEVLLTAQELSKAADAMAHIALLAQNSNQTADKASQTTASALQAVTSTVKGINNIRDTIRETEKRIKRLGERSQEITGTVNLINSISERTHILALNASMHAASAGEAGRGFAVVANEVQRLAENAREATSQIATLVNNIQVETHDTVNTMNQLINEVVEGTRLAERAGEEMTKTQQTTGDLVASVQTIATNSKTQATLSQSLLVRSQSIQESTQKTSEQLIAQGKNTDQLVIAAQQLLAAVNVFKLPSA